MKLLNAVVKTCRTLTKFYTIPFPLKTRIISILFSHKIALSEFPHYEDADRRKISESDFLHIVTKCLKAGIEESFPRQRTEAFPL
jgi:hypothetical protein